LLVLASRSPRRRDLLEAAGIAFEVGEAPDIDETPPTGLDPGAAVEHLASLKLEAVLQRAVDCQVLTADTLVFLDGAPLGKPADGTSARAMLRSLSGRVHAVATGVALAGPDPEGGVRIVVGHAVTGVRFRELTDAEIDAYVATGEPLDKAGAYAIQGGAAGFVASLDGPEDNVIGLPIELVHGLLGAIASSR
jgi:septum formation protein